MESEAIIWFLLVASLIAVASGRLVPPCLETPDGGARAVVYYAGRPVPRSKTLARSKTLGSSEQNHLGYCQTCRSPQSWLFHGPGLAAEVSV